MKISKALSALLQDAKEDESYWVERVKLDFATSLENQRRRTGLSYKAVAEKVRSSAAYISKVFRGDTNLTIESMVKLANATGGCLEVRVIAKEDAAKSWGPIISRASADSGRIRHLVSVSAATETKDADNDGNWQQTFFKRAA